MEKMKTVVDVYAAYLNENGRAENTVLAYQRDLNKLAEYLKMKNVELFEAADEAMLESYVVYMEENGMSKTTIARKIAVIKKFYQYLSERKMVKEGIANNLKAPKIERKEPKRIDLDDWQEILQSFDAKTPKQVRDKAMLWILFSTGINVESIVNLKIEDINFELGYLSTKKGAYMLSSKAYAILQTYMSKYRDLLMKGKEDNGYVFPNFRGGKLSRQGLWKIVGSYGKTANGENVITPCMIKLGLVNKK